MSWVAVILLALLCFAVGAFALRLPRTSWAMLGGVLCLGLAGYAWQASPGVAAAPKAAPAVAADNGALLVEARSQFVRDDRPVPRHMIFADALARRGSFAEAAEALSVRVKAEPRDGEAWTALAIALTAQADGTLTPAAQLAFERAHEAWRGNPAPGFFLGAAVIEQGDLVAGRSIWAQAIAESDEGAPGRTLAVERLALLDQFMAQTASQQDGASDRLPQPDGGANGPGSTAEGPQSR